MLALGYSSGAIRCELQYKPICLPTTALAGLSQTEKDELKAADYACLIWNGNTLQSYLTDSTWSPIFTQFQADVLAQVGTVVPAITPGKTSIVDGNVV